MVYGVQSHVNGAKKPVLRSYQVLHLVQLTVGKFFIRTWLCTENIQIIGVLIDIHDRSEAKNIMRVSRGLDESCACCIGGFGTLKRA